MSSYVTEQEHSRSCYEDKSIFSFGKQRYQQVVPRRSKSCILLPGKYIYLMVLMYETNMFKIITETTATYVTDLKGAIFAVYNRKYGIEYVEVKRDDN